MTFFKFFMYRMQGVLAFLKTLNSYRGWLLFCLFNQSELTSLVTQCRVSEKMNMNSADHFSPVVCCGEAVLTCVQVR